jgi:hypothetical protein
MKKSSLLLFAKPIIFEEFYLTGVASQNLELEFQYHLAAMTTLLEEFEGVAKFGEREHPGNRRPTAVQKSNFAEHASSGPRSN